MTSSGWTPGVTIRTSDHAAALFYKKCYDEGTAIKMLGMTAVVRRLEIDMLPLHVRCTIELQQVYKVCTATVREMERSEYRSAG